MIGTAPALVLVTLLLPVPCAGCGAAIPEGRVHVAARRRSWHTECHPEGWLRRMVFGSRDFP